MSWQNLRRIPKLEEVAGAGKMETDAPESTRKLKFLEERVSLRYRREDEEPAREKKPFFPPVS